MKYAVNASVYKDHEMKRTITILTSVWRTHGALIIYHKYGVEVLNICDYKQ